MPIIFRNLLDMEDSDPMGVMRGTNDNAKKAVISHRKQRYLKTENGVLILQKGIITL